MIIDTSNITKGWKKGPTVAFLLFLISFTPVFYVGVPYLVKHLAILMTTVTLGLVICLVCILAEGTWSDPL